MAEEKKEKWMNYLALSTVIFAVCATLSTSKGGGFGSKVQMSQLRASDLWTEFEAKSNKSYIFDARKENLELHKDLLDLISKTPNAKDAEAKYQVRIENCEKKLKQYEADKAELMAEAKKWEADRDEYQKHSGPFGLAVIFLQIAIVLSAVAGIMKKKIIWYLSLAVGTIGILYFINGFILKFTFLM